MDAIEKNYDTQIFYLERKENYLYLHDAKYKK